LDTADHPRAFGRQHTVQRPTARDAQHHRQRSLRRLDELEIAGIIERRQDENGTQYALSTAGEELRPVVEQPGVWGRRWLPTDYREEDLDPRLLVWDIHRNLHLDEVPGRTVIELHCLTHPGGDVDLHLSSNVRTLTNIWMGNTTWASALREGTLKLSGNSDVRRALPRWLKLNVFAPIKPTARLA
jgi:hypothetical protein